MMSFRANLCEALESRCLLSALPAPLIHVQAPFAAALLAQSAAITQPVRVSSSPIGTTGLKLRWPKVAGATKYRIAYIPGAFVPGSGGNRKTVEVGGTATSATLSNLRSFTLYSIDVTPYTSAGAGPKTHVNAWTAAQSNLQRYLYAFNLPKSRQGFQRLKPQIEVFDISHGHQWAKNIPLPKGIYNVRGVAASVITGRMYLSFFDHFQDGYQPGGLLCMDLLTGAVIWTKRYDPNVVGSPDRFALTPDGKKIYLPAGENGGSDVWGVIDAMTGNVIKVLHHVTSPHNTNISVDGRYAFLEGQEKAPQAASLKHTVAVVDTKTDTIIKRVGPFSSVVRPFTINGKASLIFATVHNMIGFEVGDVASGKVIYRVKAPVKQPAADGRTHSHGIALTPDEREVYVVDNDHRGLHVWDVSNVPAGPPKYIGFIKTRATGKNLQGQVDPAASNDATGVPAWVAASYDGKYMYAESGEIIDVATHKIIGQLRGKTTDSSGRLIWGPYTHSRFILEVDFLGTTPVNVTDQFGVGRVR